MRGTFSPHYARILKEVLPPSPCTCMRYTGHNSITMDLKFFPYFLLFSAIIHILTITTIASDLCASEPFHFDVTLIPIYSKCSPFKLPNTTDSLFNTIMVMASTDSQRLSYLSSLLANKRSTSAPVASGQVLNIGNYVVRAKLGTPGQLMIMVLDTSSDEAWVPCTGCTGCSAVTFAPKASTTFRPLDCSVPQCSQVRGFSCPGTISDPCSFNHSYAGSSFSATLVQDSLRLGSDIIPNYAFGCVNNVNGGPIPSQGLLGLGRGPVSLFSQVGSLYRGVFSYCLPSFRSHFFSGSLKLGPKGQPKRIRTTPLLRNPRRPSLYYVNLTGVSVGRILVRLPSELLSFNPYTGAGTIIDSGTVITRFVGPVYNAIRDEFRKQVRGPFTSLGAFDTCFEKTYETVAPIFTFQFSGLDLVLPLENSLIHSSSGSLACLAMAASPNNVNSVLNVIANLQQQNLRILFDTVNNKVGIARELCN